MKTKLLLLGDEAFALGALNNGLSGAYGSLTVKRREISIRNWL